MHLAKKVDCWCSRCKDSIEAIPGHSSVVVVSGNKSAVQRGDCQLTLCAQHALHSTACAQEASVSSARMLFNKIASWYELNRRGRQKGVSCMTEGLLILSGAAKGCSAPVRRMLFNKIASWYELKRRGRQNGVSCITEGLRNF
jgi:hypothetical protein